MLMTAETRIPPPTIANPDYEREIDRRAVMLCATSEPHTETIPCVPHHSEARKRVFELYQGQSDSAAVSARTL